MRLHATCPQEKLRNLADEVRWPNEKHFGVREDFSTAGATSHEHHRINLQGGIYNTCDLTTNTLHWICCTSPMLLVFCHMKPCLDNCQVLVVLIRLVFPHGTSFKTLSSVTESTWF